MRFGWIFLGAYLAMLALIVLFIVFAGGHMSGLLLLFPALPWSLIGLWSSRDIGIQIGVCGGLLVNAGLVFVLGLGTARLLHRRGGSEN